MDTKSSKGKLTKAKWLELVNVGVVSYQKDTRIHKSEASACIYLVI